MSVEDYVLTLTDHDGIELSSTTYKVNEGNAIALDCKSVKIGFGAIASSRNAPGKSFDSTSNFTSLIGEVVVAGVNNKSVDLDCVIWANTNRPSSGASGTPLTYNLLNDLVTFNHTYYLKDYTGSDSSVKTPLKSLEGTTDPVGTALPLVQDSKLDSRYLGSRGLPVVIKSAVDVSRGVDDVMGRFVVVKLSLIEDK